MPFTVRNSIAPVDPEPRLLPRAAMQPHGAGRSNAAARGSEAKPKPGGPRSAQRDVTCSEGSKHADGRQLESGLGRDRWQGIAHEATAQPDRAELRDGPVRLPAVGGTCDDWATWSPTRTTSDAPPWATAQQTHLNGNLAGLAGGHRCRRTTIVPGAPQGWSRPGGSRLEPALSIQPSELTVFSRPEERYATQKRTRMLATRKHQ